MYQLNRLSYRHDAIINWLVCNPDKTLGECAAVFGYSQAWLSQVVNSDMFQAAYQARAKSLGVEVIHSVKNQLVGLASIAMEKTAERIATGTASDKLLIETTKNVLNALGYVPNAKEKEGEPNQHLHVHVDAQTLIAAREKAAQARMLAEPVDVPALPPPGGGHYSTALPSPEVSLKESSINSLLDAINLAPAQSSGKEVAVGS